MPASGKDSQINYSLKISTLSSFTGTDRVTETQMSLYDDDYYSHTHTHTHTHTNIAACLVR